MDKSDFDALTRLLSNPGSRRGTLAILGGTFGLLGWQVRSNVVLAKKRKKKHKRRGGTTSPPPPSLTCPPPYTPCGDQCVDLSDNTSNCGACAVVCSSGKVCCNGVCVNLQDNDSNCESCGHQCLPDPIIDGAHGAVCVNGTCEQCALAGHFPVMSPLSQCCRGLHRCTNGTTGRDDCVPDGTPC
jgi:hypothetical protein